MFPTDKLPDANVQGSVQGPNAEVTVQGGPGITLHTRTGADGRYAFYLEPGHYSVQARELRGAGISRRLEVDVSDGGSGPVQLEALTLGGELERGLSVEPPLATPKTAPPPLERDIPALELPTPTPTTGPRTLDPGIRLPTPTPTPEKPSVRLPGGR